MLREKDSKPPKKGFNLKIISNDSSKERDSELLFRIFQSLNWSLSSTQSCRKQLEMLFISKTKQNKEKSFLFMLANLSASDRKENVTSRH